MRLKFFSLIFCTALFSSQAFAQTDKEINEKLSIISTLLVNDQYIALPEDSILRKYLKVEVVSQDVFLAKQKTRVNWMVTDTSKFKKKNGVLRLPFTTRTKTYTDKITEGEDYEEYHYLGQIPFLGVYILQTQLWEDMNYDLLSKKNGVSLGVFGSLPYLSPNKKKLITAYADPYETDCEIVVYSITNGKLLNSIYVRFANWMPAADDLVFWGADGKLYLAFQFSENFWNTEGNYNTDYRYARISLL